MTMTTPPEPPKTLTDALIALQARLPKVGKAGEGQVGPRTYKYATLPDLTDALFPIMAGLGLTWFCRPTVEDGQFVLAYTLAHGPSGNEIGGWYPLPSSGTPQQIGSAITYARRYALTAITGIAPDDDDDGAAAERAAQSDAERDAAGRMTAEQQREHAALRRMPRSRRAERGPVGAEDDVWSGQPAGQWDEPTPEDQPGTSNARQHQQLGILYSQLGITERDTRLMEMQDRVGRKITSSKDLSYREADQAIKDLSALAAKGRDQ